MTEYYGQFDPKDTLRRPEGKVIPPLKSIRKHCLECMGGSWQEVERCTAPACWLYPYRAGIDPRKEKRRYSDEQREIMAARLKALPKR